MLFLQSLLNLLRQQLPQHRLPSRLQNLLKYLRLLLLSLQHRLHRLNLLKLLMLLSLQLNLLKGFRLPLRQKSR